MGGEAQINLIHIKLYHEKKKKGFCLQSDELLIFLLFFFIIDLTVSHPLQNSLYIKEGVQKLKRKHQIFISVDWIKISLHCVQIATATDLRT